VSCHRAGYRPTPAVGLRRQGGKRQTSGEGRTKLTVGLVPIADVAPVHLGGRVRALDREPDLDELIRPGFCDG
jgi:hypothetical protein